MKLMNEADFAGTLYRADSPHAARVRVHLAAEGVVARSEDGSEHHIPFAACELERGGLNGRVWTCRTADRGLTLLIEDPGFPSALRERAPVDLVAAIDRILLSGARAERRSRANWIVAVALLCAFIAGTYYAVRTAGAAAVDVLPNSVDASLGEQSFARIKAQSVVLEDPVLAAALNHTLERLTSSGPDPRAFTYQVHLFDDPSPNAFALPGGNLVVHTGLIRAAQSAEQLAGVLAHEIAHVLQKHHLKAIQKGAQTALAGDALSVALKDARSSQARDKLLSLGTELYSRGLDKADELEADRLGVVLAARAGYDSYGLPAVLQTLQAMNAQDSSLALMFKTHPAPGERLSMLAERMQPVLDAYAAQPQLVERFAAEVRIR